MAGEEAFLRKHFGDFYKKNFVTASARVGKTLSQTQHRAGSLIDASSIYPQNLRTKDGLKVLTGADAVKRMIDKGAIELATAKKKPNA